MGALVAVKRCSSQWAKGFVKGRNNTVPCNLNSEWKHTSAYMLSSILSVTVIKASRGISSKKALTSVPKLKIK